jgi:hypothetical protein
LSCGDGCRGAGGQAEAAGRRIHWGEQHRRGQVEAEEKRGSGPVERKGSGRSHTGQGWSDGLMGQEAAERLETGVVGTT